MNIRVFFISLTLLVTLSCKKEAEGPDSLICVKEIGGNADKLLLPTSEVDTIHLLFAKNNLDYSHLQFYQFVKDPHLNGYAVRSYQYVNGLKLFSHTLTFNFDENKTHYFTSGDIFTTINLDNLASLNTMEVGELYKKTVIGDDTYPHDKGWILNGCFYAHFGYYDLNAINGNQPADFVKAWKVTPDPEGSGYPELYADDATAEVISYDNGIRF